jgi:hypothetical protein
MLGKNSQLMLWHEGVNQRDGASSTNGNQEIECRGVSAGNPIFEWRLETNDGKTAQFISDEPYFNLVKGHPLLMAAFGEDSAVKQSNRDFSDRQVNAGSLTEFGQFDPATLAFKQYAFAIQDDISGCDSPSTPSGDRSDGPDVDAAQKDLNSFFAHLHAGEYEQAAAFCGGVYRVLQDLNPNIDPDDPAALFKNACTINGADCLTVRQSELVDQPSTVEFQFSVEFSNEDGSLFSRGPCCGDENPDHVAQTAFIYTVQYGCAGQYQVVEPSVLGP